ncbi:MAG: hypothetical protein CVU11_00880 [Bacteroidetes bacterium HGW-Bacteroidetes-6]|jgi:tRNA pseudouridine-54 N-methylase|nr:MAG: hypothetical protein CVU11_00880 [Bacteroidetes bacterium HGW-Bacteroidetes-6]
MKSILFVFVVAALLSACNTSARYRSSSSYYSNTRYGSDMASVAGGIPAQYGDMSGGKADLSSEESNQAFNVSQMIIYNARIDVTVRNIDSANSSIIATAKKYEGYVVSVSNSYTSIRVKSENLDKALADLQKMGKMTSKNVYGTDITMEYNNLTIRLDNAYKARTRYLELLSKAEDVKAALEVEKELERLNKEIDLLEMQKNNYKQQVDYSLINVSLTERTQPGILGYVAIGLYKSVKWLFIWH